MSVRPRHLVALVAVGGLLLAPSAAQAAKGGKPGGGGGGGGPAGAVVSLGDSYISGEAGRWFGNSLDNSGSRDGTDRAHVKRGGGSYDPTLVYVDGTYANGCHRSDIADVHNTGTGLTSINLACSGAVTRNIWRSASGGQSQNGEAPQADRLGPVAAANDVDVVVLSIGGNDLGFSDIIIACTEAWFTSPSWWENHCHPDEQPGVDQKMPQAMADVGTAIDEVRAVMSASGYSAADYRLILRSYPSPIPRSAENRYPESGWSRWDTGGCPFWNEDSDWARDSLVPQISDNLAAVAASKGVEFLDMSDALQGREVCSTSRSLVTSSPNGGLHEWVRWLNTGWNQGDAQESLHPNVFGQQAAGRCLGLMIASAPGDYACVPSGGSTPDDMAVVPV